MPKDKGYELNEDQEKKLPSPDDDGYYSIPVKFRKVEGSLMPVDILGRKYNVKDENAYNDAPTEDLIGITLPPQTIQ